MWCVRPKPQPMVSGRFERSSSFAAMVHHKSTACAMLVALSLALTAAANAQESQTESNASKHAKA